jgi:hypothetical protein
LKLITLCEGVALQLVEFGGTFNGLFWPIPFGTRVKRMDLYANRHPASALHGVFFNGIPCYGANHSSEDKQPAA